MTTNWIITNCLTCGTGSYWWLQQLDGPRCPVCHGDPEIRGSGDPDHDLRQRQRMIKQFGWKRPGDELLLDENPRRGRERYEEYRRALSVDSPQEVWSYKEYQKALKE